MKFLKKNWGNLLFLVAIALLIIPQTRMPIQVFVQRIISFSPSEVPEEEQTIVTDFNWTLTNLDGTSNELATSKGKVTIINFWATWCAPCVAEMPAFQNLYDAFGDRVDFYFVSNETPETLQAFLDKNNYTFPVQRYITAPPGQLEAEGLPTTFVLSKSGKTVVKKVGAADWDNEKVKEMLVALLAG